MGDRHVTPFSCPSKPLPKPSAPVSSLRPRPGCSRQQLRQTVRKRLRAALDAIPAHHRHVPFILLLLLLLLVSSDAVPADVVVHDPHPAESGGEGAPRQASGRGGTAPPPPDGRGGDGEGELLPWGGPWRESRRHRASLRGSGLGPSGSSAAGAARQRVGPAARGAARRRPRLPAAAAAAATHPALLAAPGGFFLRRRRRWAGSAAGGPLR